MVQIGEMLRKDNNGVINNLNRTEEMWLGVLETLRSEQKDGKLA